jgi:hypothetical protein
MSVTFIKRTGKSWQVTLQGKVTSNLVTNHFPHAWVNFLQEFKESGHGGPHVETHEEVNPSLPALHSTGT